jgi:PAS domain-containing protein
MEDAARRPRNDRDLADLMVRRDALRQSAALPGAQLPQVLEAAFAELDGAIEMAAARGLAAPPQPAGSHTEAGDAERKLLRAAFADAPVPLFLLERNGTIRRANRRAGELLGSQPGYATGKLFTAFVDLPSRAAAASQLAAVARTGRPQHVSCALLGAAGTVDVLLAVNVIEPAQGPALMIVAAASPGHAEARGGDADANDADADAEAASAGEGEGAPERGAARSAGGPKGAAGAGRRGQARTVEAITQRMDLVTAVTRLLLENATFSEPVTLQRCARLLAGELATWVIVDVERRQRLRRQVVIGPPTQESSVLAKRIAALSPPPGSLPHQVYESGSSQLIAHAEDVAVLGTDRDGVPLLMLMGATSVLCVPLSDGERTYGVLTLARQPADRPFEIADLGLVEELGQQLALAIRVDRMFRRRTEIADSLQASLLPRELPSVPGVEFAASYVAATEELEVGGDFYDVYRTPGGWGLAIGDVCGKGEEAAAVTAAARHSIRVLAHWNNDPAQVLSQANEIMLAEEFDGRFVTACAAHLQWREDSLQVVLGSAGHPGPVVIRADGSVHMLRGGGMPLGLRVGARPSAGPPAPAPAAGR